MRKILCLAIAAAAMLLSGCSLLYSNMPEGYAQIKDAKTAYEKLDSGHLTMTDLAQDKQIVDFSFFINTRDEMVFTYYGIDGETEQYAYSDGAQYFYKTNEDERWHVIKSSDENYAYNIYNRKWRYPYARGGVFFLDGNSVESSEVINNPDGSVQITYVYNPDKLNESAVPFLEDVSGFESLETVFEINSDGYITDFTERGSVTNSEGVKYDVNMKITIDKMNDVYDIPYPVDVVYKDE